MKPGGFVMAVGMVGAVSGVLTFLLTRDLLASWVLRLATGGLAAVVIPVLLVFLFYPRLAKVDEKKKE